MPKLIHHAYFTSGGLSRRDFLKAGAAGLVVLSGCVPAIQTAPRQPSRYDELRAAYPASFRSEYGNPRESRTVRIAGVEVQVLFLQGTIAGLDSTARQNRTEAEPEQGKYAYLVNVPALDFSPLNWDTLDAEERRRVIAMLPDRNDGIAWRLEYGQMIPTAHVNGGYSIEGAMHSMGVFFPAALERRGTGTGRRLLEAEAFPELLRAVTGEVLRRVLGLAENHGTYVTFHFLAADENGNPAGRHLGGYLSCGMTFYPRTLELKRGFGLLIERGGRDPVDGRPVQ